MTTTTVSTVTTAATAEYLGQALTLVALLLLATALVAKEITAHSSRQPVRAFARGLDIGVAPLVVLFVLIISIGASVGTGG